GGGRDNHNHNKKQAYGGPSAQPNGSTGKQREKKVEYFAVQVPPTRINAILDAVFRDASPEEAKMYNTLKAQRRIQPEFHVTLIHRAAASQNAEYWAQLTDLHSKTATADNNEPKLEHSKVRLERLVWDDRIMA